MNSYKQAVTSGKECSHTLRIKLCLQTNNYTHYNDEEL